MRKSNRGFKHYDGWQEEIIGEEEAVMRNMNRRLEAERGWLNTGVAARRKRNQKRLANLHRLRQQLHEHKYKLQSAKAKLKYDLQEEAKKLNSSYKRKLFHMDIRVSIFCKILICKLRRVRKLV